MASVPPAEVMVQARLLIVNTAILVTWAEEDDTAAEELEAVAVAWWCLVVKVLWTAVKEEEDGEVWSAAGCD